MPGKKKNQKKTKKGDAEPEPKEAAEVAAPVVNDVKVSEEAVASPKKATEASKEAAEVPKEAAEAPKEGAPSKKPTQQWVCHFSFSAMENLSIFFF